MKLAGAAPSTSEARRLIAGRAVGIEGQKVEDEQLKIELLAGSTFVLKAGKKKFVRVIVE